MNISLEKTGSSAVIIVKMEKTDYQDAVKKELKHIASQVEVPGFRKGKAPYSFVEKRFGVQTKMEQVDKLLNASLLKYIEESKLEILGEPMVSSKQGQINIVAQDNFEFLFDVALAPEFEINLDNNDHIDFYDIEVTDEQVQEQVDMFARQGGHHENVEEYADKDILRGVLAEQDAQGNVLEDGISVEKASLMPTYFKNESQKVFFEGVKVGDVLTINPSEAYEGNENEVASLLHIKKEEVAEHKGNFTFQIEENSRFMPAELNQEFCDSVFEEGEVKTEEEFRNKVRELLKTQRVADADFKFLRDLRAYCEGKVGELDFCRDLLKKFMLQNLKKEENAEEIVEKDFEASLNSLRWQLIKEKLAKAYEVKVENDDIREQAVKMARVMFLRYGMPNVPEEYVEQYADKMLEDESQVRRLVDQCVEAAIVAGAKNAVSLEHKEISLAEFQKFFAAED